MYLCRSALVIAFLLGLLFQSAEGMELTGDMDNLVIGGATVASVAFLVVIIALVALCIDKKVEPEKLARGPPIWTRQLTYIATYDAGLQSVSEGLTAMTKNQVVRHRLGTSVTDGARWEPGFLEGKHVFEVIWRPDLNRGSNTSIGIGTMAVQLKKEGRINLVGSHSQSWGFGLSSRKATHSGNIVGGFARQFSSRFYMYLDMDGGKIGFGGDIREMGHNAAFYGDIIHSISMDRKTPYHVMLSMCCPRELMEIYYVGTATQGNGFDLCAVHGPQQYVPQQGVPPQGVPPQGVPPQGVPQQGVPPQGVPQQGVPPQGVPPQAAPSQAVPQQGDPAPVKTEGPSKQQ